jgi:hypothetical protein
MRLCGPVTHDSDSNEGGRALKRRDAEGMIENTPPESPKRRPGPSLDEARLRQQAIGVKLRQMFNEVVNEPVPDEFLDILRRADDKTSGSD